jgi:hypothetical protein
MADERPGNSDAPGPRLTQKKAAGAWLRRELDHGILELKDEAGYVVFMEARTSIAEVSNYRHRLPVFNLVILHSSRSTSISAGPDATSDAFRESWQRYDPEIKLCRYLGGFAAFQYAIRWAVQEWYDNWKAVLGAIDDQVRVKVGNSLNRCISLSCLCLLQPRELY